ncbi:MAG: Kdo hydroxylase family protein [Gemmataceae bacterium]
MSTTITPEGLERGELFLLPVAPFSLPDDEDRAFLLRQEAAPGCKHLCFNPLTHSLTGIRRSDPAQEARVRRLLADFSERVTAWLHEALPVYAGGIHPDRATFRPEEEATRCVRLHARNDLLHIDAFPGRPAHGRRLLRVFVNLHPTEPRIWATSESLPRLLDRFADRVRRSTAGWFHELGARLRKLFGGATPSDSDVFLLRLHDYLKNDHEFQHRGPRRLWRFPPGSAWLAMTDACSYAELRGRFALEHSFFIAPDVLCCPDHAPARLVA